ncbi:hypothetical protein J4Q44_G00393250, partial [Coregonus suidteri]
LRLPGATPHLRLPGATPHLRLPGATPHLRLPGATPHLRLPGATPHLRQREYLGILHPKQCSRGKLFHSIPRYSQRIPVVLLNYSVIPINFNKAVL